ncbi:FadR/GntR family transcriptional regulator [Cohnella hashimotonis]|uniref:FadR/GntR family transcriptional regulator n=1 Tax=Cohnella hashimotonis TaxID=2826895 RepID=A0ABT6TAL5_9BACL|nr:FadR/GntR family transcriptional regulator [Cohnella hashimotonis]MDI4643878.1 FadR/GntR family transcriptional regulator [Cohnella hashimotonis]
MRPTKIETQKGHEIVSRHIRQQLERGELVPGQKLPSLEKLAEAYGVGRSTIREAISALKAMGWLDVRHGGGTYVAKSLPGEATGSLFDLSQGAEAVMEILEVRKILERGTAELAALKRGEDDLARLREILARMERALREDDAEGGERADLAFHQAIAAASGNPVLNQLMDSISQRLSETIGRTRELWFYQEQAEASRLLEEHRGIYEAIETRDSERASERIGLHLSKVEKVLRTALEQKSDGNAGQAQVHS